MRGPRVSDNHRVKRFSPLVIYTSSRLVLFIVTATVLALAGLQGILLLMIALVVSGLLSYVLLSKQRDAVSAAVVARSRRAEPTEATGPTQPLEVSEAAKASEALESRKPGRIRWRDRLEERTRAEDAEDDARRAAEDAAGRVAEEDQG
jgi:hypothetical protein